ncbi:hypothetical protein IKF26_02215 [Candidatus Saccharibacteria bacterium]|nr:hypothetical protein [Candidatus Saccharibacteria bacterium]
MSRKKPAQKIKNFFRGGNAERRKIMAKMIRIHKQAGQKKDAIRISKASDIPDFLRSSVDIAHGKLYLTCVEGNETCPLGSVIGYETSDKTPSGYNCWCIGNAATNLVEIDGVFYKKATVMSAMAVTEEFPKFLEGANITQDPDGSWSIKTDWGVSTGFPGQAYWVKYGTKEDGTPDANILTKTEKSYQDYIVCDEEGNDIGFLSKIDPA